MAAPLQKQFSPVGYTNINTHDSALQTGASEGLKVKNTKMNIQVSTGGTSESSTPQTAIKSRKPNKLVSILSYLKTGFVGFCCGGVPGSAIGGAIGTLAGIAFGTISGGTTMPFAIIIGATCGSIAGGAFGGGTSAATNIAWMYTNNLHEQYRAGNMN
ncbi:hypothetical protein [Parendozoicomonas sp. Alg238-R29]|uniref:hypothetical protein n=1 Tax=Parendozoicomonas sp. Alg238-R29 TaxID=2993446 RepID=UPI00248E2144|nr:hypothetical protein [Parendozoicomonas sp. Alg238-R29]